MAYVGALGGTAAAVGGPIAVALVVGIYVTAEIYTMVRAVELTIYKLIQNKEVENRVSTSHLYFLRRALA